MLTKGAFDSAFIWTADGETRSAIADAIETQAKVCALDGRPDLAGLLRYCGSQIYSGGRPSKKSRAKASKQLAIVRSRLPD